MKLWFLTATALIMFSGCSSRTQNIKLQNKNAKQSLIIQQQQAQIDALNVKLVTREKARERSTLLPPPKKNIKLKKVEDDNYTSEYMYPRVIKKNPVKVIQSTIPNANTSMDKAQCIEMIGPEKFAKYAQMFGSEAASLKRCKMLKAMKQ